MSRFTSRKPTDFKAFPTTSRDKHATTAVMAPKLLSQKVEAKEQFMLSHEELARIREEREVLETWRTYARHAVADMLEACAICGAVRDKEHLVRCRWCEDLYICKEGVCAQKHQAELHPAVAFWTW